MRLKSIGVLRGYAMGKTQLSRIADNIEHEVDEALESERSENAKLRELCRHLYMCNQYCDREDSNGGCSACPYQLLEYDCGFEERLLKLGIEVDA